MKLQIRELLRCKMFPSGVPTGTKGTVLEPVELEQIARFGKLNTRSDARQWTVAELKNGEIVYLLMQEQSSEATKLIRKRLKGIFADAYMARVGLAITWEDDPELRAEIAKRQRQTEEYNAWKRLKSDL